MKVIIGLGNPTAEYANTRHNAGFSVIDCIAEKAKIKVIKLKFKALTGDGVINENRVMLVKPQTFMNLSGEAVAGVINFYKLTHKDIIVVFDDTTLPLGKIRIRGSGSDGGHNGVKDIINKLGTDEFLRVKVGIGEKPDGWDLKDYVLSKFGDEEQKVIADSVKRAAEAAVFLLGDDVATAMNRFN